MKKSTGVIDKNGIEVFVDDKLYCYTNNYYGMVIEIDGRFFVQFEKGIVECNPWILETWNMEVV